MPQDNDFMAGAEVLGRELRTVGRGVLQASKKVWKRRPRRLNRKSDPSLNQTKKEFLDG